MPLWACLKFGSLKIFDQMSAASVIPITDHTRFVRHENHR